MELPNIEFDSELSAFDYMLYRADMNTRTRTSMMFIEMLDEAPEEERLLARVDFTTRAFPRFRQRVVAPLVPLTPPRWVVDPDFSLNYHVRRVVLPGPGDQRQLLDYAAVVQATPLDLERPLWELTVVEGLDLPDARAAVLWKMSHVLTDGVGGMMLDQLMHDDERDPADLPAVPAPAPEDLTSMELTKAGLRRAPRQMLVGGVRRGAAILRMTRDVAGHPAQSAGELATAVTKLGAMAKAPKVEPSPLLKRRGLGRRFDNFAVPLTELRRAAKHYQCSVNDAYLAAVTGGLRRYHEELGVPVDAIQTAIPISVRPSNDAAAGNHWSAVTMPLPLAEPDVQKRMRSIREQVLTARDSAVIDVAAVAAPVLAWVPQALIASGGPRSLGIDIQISNVPGHPTDRFVAGARVTRTIPLGPLPGVAAMVTMVSMTGQCSVGVHYDTDAVRHPELFERCLREGFDEVLTASRAAEPSSQADTQTPKKAAAAKKTPAKKTPAKKAPTKKAAKRSTGGTA